MPREILRLRKFGGKEYHFAGAFWYKGDAERMAKNLSKDAMGRPFHKSKIVRYDSYRFHLPYLTLGEVRPEARRIGLGRSGRLTDSIFVVYSRRAYKE